jgi:hypothetical protein
MLEKKKTKLGISYIIEADLRNKQYPFSLLSDISIKIFK